MAVVEPLLAVRLHGHARQVGKLTGRRSLHCPRSLVARPPTASARRPSARRQGRRQGGRLFAQHNALASPTARRLRVRGRRRQLGRAACRERVCQYVSISVVAVSLKKTNKINPSTKNSNHINNYNKKRE